MTSPPGKLSNRIRAAMASCGYETALQLSEASGINPATLSRMLSGRIISPHRRTLEALSTALGIEVSELTQEPDVGHKPFSNRREDFIDKTGGPNTKSNRSPHMLPMMNTEGNLDYGRLVASFIPLGPEGFVWQVTGDSMISADSMSYPHNCLVICSKVAPPKPGNRVVANLDGTVLMKELIEDMGELHLRSLNPSYERKAVVTREQILGVVVGKMEYEQI